LDEELKQYVAAFCALIFILLLGLALVKRGAGRPKK
jgi:hypothetical protein